MKHFDATHENYNYIVRDLAQIGQDLSYPIHCFDVLRRKKNIAKSHIYGYFLAGLIVIIKWSHASPPISLINQLCVNYFMQRK